MRTFDKKGVVIGAGLGGLAVALQLAHRGWQVTVIERNTTPGGKMNRWKADGYVFDTGPSLITMPWVFENFFASVGIRLRDHIEWMRVEPVAEYRFADGTRFTHTSDLVHWLNTIRQLNSHDVPGFLRMMALGERLFALSRKTFLEKSPYELPDRHAFRALWKLPLRHAWGQYHKSVTHFLRDPRLQQMFDRYVTYVGSSPYASPATLLVIPYLEYAFGAWHIKGGLYRLVEVFSRLLEERGAAIVTGTTVKFIRHSRGQVEGVELATGEFIPSDVVVMNGDASKTPVLLGENKRQYPAKKRSLSGVVLLFALREHIPHSAHHTVCFSQNYAEEFRQLFEERRFPDDPTVYVNMPTRTDTSMAPSSGDVMFVMANAPADAENWTDQKTEIARTRILERLRKSGFPEFLKCVVAAAAFTPRDFAERYDMPGGAIYGQASHGWAGAFLRPPNRHPRIRGLYLVGGSTHPGGGTPTVLLSAQITTRLLLKDHA